MGDYGKKTYKILQNFAHLMKSATNHLHDYQESSEHFNDNFSAGLGNHHELLSHHGVMVMSLFV